MTTWQQAYYTFLLACIQYITWQIPPCITLAMYKGIRTLWAACGCSRAIGERRSSPDLPDPYCNGYDNLHCNPVYTGPTSLANMMVGKQTKKHGYVAVGRKGGQRGANKCQALMSQVLGPGSINQHQKGAHIVYFAIRLSFFFVCPWQHSNSLFIAKVTNKRAIIQYIIHLHRNIISHQ